MPSEEQELEPEKQLLSGKLALVKEEHAYENGLKLFAEQVTCSTR